MHPRIAHLLEHSPRQDGYDYTLDLMRKLLAHASLGLDFVGSLDEPDLATRLTAYQPHLLVLWEHHGALLRAFGTRKRSLDDWKGYVWLTEALVPGVKCIATYAPRRLQMEWSLTGVVRMHLGRAAREAGVEGLVVPERHVEVAAPWHGFTAQDIVNGLGLLRAKQCPIAHDLEGGCGMGPSCLGFAYGAHDAFVVPIYDVDGVSVWSEEDEILIWQAVLELLEDPLVPKIIQNALYELFVLAWTTGIVVQGLQDDTMVKHFELLAELEKSLEFQASIYTQQPYWKLEHRVVEGRYVPFKDGRRATSEEWYIYNGTDCCVTYEVNQVMDTKLLPRQRDHYLFNMQLLVPLAYMSLRGLRYDHAKAKERLAEVQQRIYELQDEINREAARSPERAALRQFYEALGVETATGGLPEVASQLCEAKLLTLLTSAFCQARRTERVEVEEVSWQPHKWNGKRWIRKGRQLEEPPTDAHGDILPADFPGNPEEAQTFYLAKRKQVSKRVPAEVKTLEDVQRFVLGSKQQACLKACRLARRHSDSNGLTPAQRGELSTLLGLHCNTESTAAGGDAQWFLYEHCKFDKQFAKDGNKKTDRLTTDTEALLRIWTKTQDPRCKLVLALRAALTAVETLAADCDDDGRIRTAYNLVGTNTGRLSSYESPTGSGFNLQTVTKRDRDLFGADPGMDLYSCDLSGADSWTVAAHAAHCGDSTMLDDLLNKLKPAKIVALMQLHGLVINSKSRDELRLLSKEVPEEGGLYPASKATTHGSNYGMKSITMASNILKQSYKKTGVPIVVAASQCDRLQTFYFSRYGGVPKWQAGISSQIRTTGKLTTPFGFTRRFFGRKDDQATLREALSFEPQANTTWATNMMLLRLWTDPDNRRPDGTLIVEPLHQVHDAAMFQGPAELRGWIKNKVQSWFNNSLTIGGVTVTIPYEAGVGPDWKHLESL